MPAKLLLWCRLYLSCAFAPAARAATGCGEGLGIGCVSLPPREAPDKTVVFVQSLVISIHVDMFLQVLRGPLPAANGRCTTLLPGLSPPLNSGKC